MDDAEILAELEAIQARVARLVAALRARSGQEPTDVEARRTLSRITTDELDALTNEELRRLSEDRERG
jgi:hypothetical protein